MPGREKEEERRREKRVRAERRIRANRKKKEDEDAVFIRIILLDGTR